MVDSGKHKDWTRQAGIDLAAARTLMGEEQFYPLVCYHCQQAVEKALKGFLIKKTGYLRPGHHLLKLLLAAAQFQPKFSALDKDCALINEYYTASRYPSEDPLDISREAALECVDIAKRILDLAHSGDEE